MTTGEKRDPPKIFVVSWEDTTSIAAWHDEDELRDFIDNRAWLCSNVGYLVHEDSECVVVAGRLSKDGRYTGLIERIPRRAIIGMYEVKAPSAWAQ